MVKKQGVLFKNGNPKLGQMNFNRVCSDPHIKMSWCGGGGGGVGHFICIGM